MAVWLRTNAAADPAVWFGVNDFDPESLSINDMVFGLQIDSLALSSPTDLSIDDLVFSPEIDSLTLTTPGQIFKTNNLVVF